MRGRRNQGHTHPPAKKHFLGGRRGPRASECVSRIHGVCAFCVVVGKLCMYWRVQAISLFLKGTALTSFVGIVRGTTKAFVPIDWTAVQSVDEV